MNYKLDLQRTVVLPDLGIVVPPKPRHGSAPPSPEPKYGVPRDLKYGGVH